MIHESISHYLQVKLRIKKQSSMRQPNLNRTQNEDDKQKAQTELNFINLSPSSSSDNDDDGNAKLFFICAKNERELEQK